MSQFRVLVVDDEKPARTRLVELLEKESDVKIVALARDGREAVQAIRAHGPDLVFLDIQMPGMDGFGVLQEIGPERMPVTMFVTAYDQYAIRAFESHALDYLLKPFSDERFEGAIQRARQFILNRVAGELGAKLAGLLQEREYMQKIVLKSGGRVTFLDVGEVDWIEAAGVYVNLHVGSKSILYRATVGQISQRLDPRRFVRVHRSAVVNTERIRELQPRSHGDYIVVLKDGVELTLSRGYRSQFEGWLKQTL